MSVTAHSPGGAVTPSFAINGNRLFDQPYIGPDRGLSPGRQINAGDALMLK